MQPFLTIEGVTLATVLAFIVGGLRYSPLLFMNLWLKGKGMTATELPKRSKWYLFQTMVYAFIAHGCIATVLALVLDIAEPETMQVTLSLSALLAIGFIMSTRFIDMVYTIDGKHYDKKNQINFLVTSLYYVVIVLVMAATLFCVR